MPSPPFRVLFLLVLSALSSSASLHKNDSFVSSDCNSPDTFVCPREGSCIPLDWVGDGEKDCEDGADEFDSGGGRDDPFSMLVSATQPQNGSLASPNEPSGELAISSTFFSPPLSPISAPASCQNCSGPLETWVGQLVDMLDSDDNRSSSMFGHPKCRSLLSRACPLLTVCAECPPKSVSGPLFPWTRLQLFLCELLEPTLRDHSKCLGTIPSGCAKERSSSIFLSPHCRFLHHSLRSVECLEAASSQSQCSDSALEMMGPLRSEAEHWMEELKCSSNLDDRNDSTTAMLTDKWAFPSPTTTTTTTAPPSPSPSFSPSLDFSAIPSTSSNQSVSPKVEHQQQVQAEDADFLWDTLSSLARTEQMCAIGHHRNKRADGETAIWTKVCDRADVFNANGLCLEELARREGSKCTGGRQIHANASSSTCALIDAFGKTVDCAVGAMNELCPVEVQEAVVAIQEQLNDEAISRQCFAQQRETSVAEAEAEVPDEFPLSPLNPKCSSEQEESSLVCLVELAELNGRFQRLPSLQMLFADKASLVLPPTPKAYSLPHKFAPIPHRIGLAPLCSARARRFLLDRSSACLNAPLAQCHMPMEAVGRAVGAMLQGVHGQAHLCKAFYSLRAAFRCGQQTMRERCAKDGEVLVDLENHLAEMLRTLESLGLEEGCPVEEPPQLDALLSRRVIPSRLSVPVLPFAAFAVHGTPGTSVAVAVDGGPSGGANAHPLAVIKQPRLIDQACQAFLNFSECRARVQCFPLWARGMSAMFDFACGPQGNALYLEVRQCIRRNIARQNIKECVVAFSRGAPQDACPSARRLVDCAVPEIGERCGERAAQFVREYVAVFARAVDANCALFRQEEREKEEGRVAGGETESGGRKGPIAALNCSEEQQQLVRHCAVPLESLHARLGDLFQGGLQNVLKNLNGLAPLFAQGCVLGAQFRQCLAPLSADNRCVVSSCLVAAGAGICDQPDAAQAIDTHLGCVFRQISDPEFGKCLRTTLVPIKQFSLASLRQALPQFVDCVHDIVQRTCGSIPLNVLRVLASKDNICPVTGRPVSEQFVGNGGPSNLYPFLSKNLTITTALPPATCTPEMKRIRLDCQHDFLLSKYAFRPVSLLRDLSNASSNPSPEAFCAGDFEALSQCMRRTAPCDTEEPYGHARALRALGTAICSARVEFSRRARCVETVAEGAEGRKCTAQYEQQRRDELLGNAGDNDGTLCGLVNTTTQCLAQRVFSECGSDSLEFVFSATNEYLAQIIPGNGCQLEVPSLAIQHSTGCPEQQLIAFLECESHVDHFRPRPLALISDQSEWETFCLSAQTKFKPCVEGLKCRPEPAAGAALTLHDTVCEREIARRDQRRFGACLLKVTEADSVRQCLNNFRLVDLLGRDAGPRVCAAVDELLLCSANTINSQCGEEALLHVYDVYNGWSSAYHPSCALSPPNLTKVRDEDERGGGLFNVTKPTAETTTLATTGRRELTARGEEREGATSSTASTTTTTTTAAAATTAGKTSTTTERTEKPRGTTPGGGKRTEPPKGPNGASTATGQPIAAAFISILSAFLSLCTSWRWRQRFV
uniref:DUF19 domain-containing protein n=1 Tax=Globodera pallida TaxID=36090 RepID=A0A183BRV6_GLOPA